MTLQPMNTKITNIIKLRSGNQYKLKIWKIKND